jgi:hypothetical protein
MGGASPGPAPLPRHSPQRPVCGAQAPNSNPNPNPLQRPVCGVQASRGGTPPLPMSSSFEASSGASLLPPCPGSAAQRARVAGCHCWPDAEPCHRTRPNGPHKRHPAPNLRPKQARRHDISSFAIFALASPNFLIANRAPPAGPQGVVIWQTVLTLTPTPIGQASSSGRRS